MKHLVLATSVVAVAWGSIPAAARETKPQRYISDQMRNAPASVAVRIGIAQGEIKSEIDSAYVQTATGGGLLSALISSAIDASRAKKAEMLITPLRDGLTGFDVDQLAIDTANQEVRELSWLNAGTASFSKDESSASELAYLDKIPESHLALVSFSYDVSPDFSSVRVVQTFSIAPKANQAPTGKAIRPDDRILPRYLTYVQSVTAVITLPITSDPAGNAAVWAADGAEKARAALTAAFADSSQLMIKALNNTPEQIKLLDNPKNKRVTLASGYSGREVTDAPTGVSLLWAPGYISSRLLIENTAK